jgi:hypothetical protein
MVWGKNQSKRFRTTSEDASENRAQESPTRKFYIGWEHTETSEAADKDLIRESIDATFPAGFDGFNEVMGQVNQVAVMPTTDGGVWSTPAADEGLLAAVQGWYARWSGQSHSA